MGPLGAILELVFQVMNSDATGQLWNQYQAAVQEQIDAGLTAVEAQLRTSMDLLDTDPNFQAARDIFQEQYRNAPRKLRAEYDRIITSARNDRDAYQEQLAGVGEGFQERESNVMRMLEGQGEQARRDIERAFGEEQGAAIQGLTDQRLTGSGVAASVRSGFATRKADKLAGLNEDLARMRADYYSGLSGERLGFGEKAATLGYGAGQFLTGLEQGGIQDVAATEANAASQLGGFYGGMGDRALNQFNKSSDRYIDMIENINLVPPDTSGVGQGWSSFWKNRAGNR